MIRGNLKSLYLKILWLHSNERDCLKTKVHRGKLWHYDREELCVVIIRIQEPFKWIFIPKYDCKMSDKQPYACHF